MSDSEGDSSLKDSLLLYFAKNSKCYPTTSKGLQIKAELDENCYPLGKKVSDEEMEAIALEKADFHGE